MKAALTRMDASVRREWAAPAGGRSGNAGRNVANMTTMAGPMSNSPPRGNWVAAALAYRIGDTRPAHTYVAADGGRTVLSGDALVTAVRRRAAGLRAAGLRPGDRVALTT